MIPLFLHALGALGAQAALQPPRVVETPTGSRVPVPVETEQLRRDAASKVRQRFVACVYQRRPAKVEALLAASDPISVDYAAAGVDRRRISSVLAMEDCLSRATSVTDSDLVLSMNFPALRAMMLERSYLAHNPTVPAWLGKAASPPIRRFVSSGPDLPRAQVAAAFADCVVTAAPREADALIRTLPDSEAEKAAIRPLVPHLAPCITEGMQVSLQPAQLRSLVADGLWAAWRASTGQPPSALGAR